MIVVNRKEYLVIPLLILFWLEVCAITDYKQPQFSQLAATFLFLFTGFMIAVLPFLIRIRSSNPLPPAKKINFIASRIIYGAFFIALCVFVIQHTETSLAAIPIDYHNADMIPNIKVRCDRFIAGENVYAPVPEIWNGGVVAYLPAMWLPYLPLEYFGYDLRWTGVIVLLFCFGIYVLLIPRSKKILFILIPLLAICGYIFWFLFENEITYIAWTEESVVIGYYLLLGFGLIKKNPWIIGFAAAMCLMSRYTLVFWIPVYLFYAYFFESKKYALTIFAIISILFLTIFLLPYGIRQPQAFLGSLSLYLEQAINYKKWHLDFYIYDHYIGLAKLFTAEQFPLLHKMIIAIALIVPLSCLAIFISLRTQLNSVKHYFGLCSLKLTMVFFYLFIEMPFYYLFFVPVFFTLPIIILAIRGSSDP